MSELPKVTELSLRDLFNRIATLKTQLAEVERERDALKAEVEHLRDHNPYRRPQVFKPRDP